MSIPLACKALAFYRPSEMGSKNKEISISKTREKEKKDAFLKFFLKENSSRVLQGNKLSPRRLQTAYFSIKNILKRCECRLLWYR